MAKQPSIKVDGTIVEVHHNTDLNEEVFCSVQLNDGNIVNVNISPSKQYDLHKLKKGIEVEISAVATNKFSLISIKNQ